MKAKTITRMLLTCCGAMLVGACSDIPTYEWVDHQTAMTTMVQRAEAVETVAASGSLVLERANGGSIRLDSAMAMRKGGYLRARAWKLNQAVFDLTMTPQGLWLWAPSQAEGEQTPAKVGAAQFARAH